MNQYLIDTNTCVCFLTLFKLYYFSMRLTQENAKLIKTTAGRLFGDNAKIYLFGSRTDDQKKGGDIDLYIETSVKEGLVDKKIKMLQVLENRLGKQKIDIVLNNATASLYIYEVAKREGILL